MSPRLRLVSELSLPGWKRRRPYARIDGACAGTPPARLNSRRPQPQQECPLGTAPSFLPFAPRVCVRPISFALGALGDRAPASRLAASPRALSASPTPPHPTPGAAVQRSPVLSRDFRLLLPEPRLPGRGPALAPRVPRHRSALLRGPATRLASSPSARSRRGEKSPGDSESPQLPSPPGCCS